MLINNIDISKFNAKQLIVDIQPSNIILEKEWVKKSLKPIFIDYNITFKNLKITLYFHGNNRQDILTNISNLISLLKAESTLTLDGYKNKFISFLINSNIEKTIRKDRYKLNLEFDSYEVSDFIEETLNRTTMKTINIKGNLETPCIVEITPIVDIIDIKIEGLSEDPIIIKNLEKNKTLILHGIDGTITVDGINKFYDADLWEFPRLKPGSNNIKISRNDCNIKIKYKSKYV
ncbi:phage distal tail protein [Clostridium tarantellae]|uniref:Phage tail protein n=1 Tax=Clostridium tarantellae TaxID=39493 RepID=A0A6I1MN98_9CLOT|nr:phage tail protein [Clostridium tarantellae]MPQ44440.1 phage tail protein [Clostridium tarantellae]